MDVSNLFGFIVTDSFMVLVDVDTMIDFATKKIPENQIPDTPLSVYVPITTN